MLYELPEFEYFEPETLAEALSILAEFGSRAKILAGGTDLLGLLKDRIGGKDMPIPSALINIKKLKELRILRHSNIESEFGAALTLTELHSDLDTCRRFPGLAQAAASVGTNQIKNMGTLGGNLCQRPWCWYFRHPAFDCFKKGGRQCYAITGDNSTYFSVYDRGTCVMSHPSDTAPVLIALDAIARIAGPQGVTEVPISDFFLGPRNVRDNILTPEEILVSVIVPRPSSGSKSVYIKHRTRNTWDFALASVAACGSLDDEGRVSTIRLVLGGVAPRPMELKPAESAVSGRKYDEESRTAVQAIASKQSKPLRMNGYKIRIVRALLGKALDSIFSVQRA